MLFDRRYAMAWTTHLIVVLFILSPIVYGAGRCMAEGCGCELFIDEEP